MQVKNLAVAQHFSTTGNFSKVQSHVLSENIHLVISVKTSLAEKTQILNNDHPAL